MKAYSSPLGPGRLDSKGYWSISLRSDGVRPKGKYRLHRLLYEQRFGPIPHGYDIHHINGDKGDNRLENFQLIRSGEHTRQHKLGQRPSHQAAADGTIVKFCRLRDHFVPLADMVPVSDGGDGLYRSYCRPCYNAQRRRQRAAEHSSIL